MDILLVLHWFLIVLCSINTDVSATKYTRTADKGWIKVTSHLQAEDDEPPHSIGQPRPDSKHDTQRSDFPIGQSLAQDKWTSLIKKQHLPGEVESLKKKKKCAPGDSDCKESEDIEKESEGWTWNDTFKRPWIGLSAACALIGFSGFFLAWGLWTVWKKIVRKLFPSPSDTEASSPAKAKDSDAPESASDSASDPPSDSASNTNEQKNVTGTTSCVLSPYGSHDVDSDTAGYSGYRRSIRGGSRTPTDYRQGMEHGQGVGQARALSSESSTPTETQPKSKGRRLKPQSPGSRQSLRIAGHPPVGNTDSSSGVDQGDSPLSDTVSDEIGEPPMLGNRRSSKQRRKAAYAASHAPSAPPASPESTASSTYPASTASSAYAASTTSSAHAASTTSSAHAASSDEIDD